MTETWTLLRSERARRPELAGTLDLHIAILEARAQVRIQNSRGAFSLPNAEARTRLERGMPLLRAEDLALDWEAVARLAQAILAIVAQHRRDDLNGIAEIADELKSPARVEQLACDYLAGANQAGLVAFVLNNALHPSLNALAQKYKTLIDDAAWYRAYCPICGGAPDFAALEKASGARRLLCARCDFEWTFQRAICPFCAQDAPGKLGYFTSDYGAYRLYTCENCKRYLKTIDLRELARDVNLPAERVLTIALDVAARQAGFT